MKTTSPSLSKFEGYQRAKEAAKLAIEVSSQWRGWADLVTQVRKAATSTPMNLAEGNAFPPESPRRRAHFEIAFGSALELESALELAHTFELGDPEELRLARLAAGRSAAIITKLIARLR